MNFFTIAYLVRFHAWALAVVFLQGWLVAWSWLAWERVMANATVALRHRLACLHFAALVVLPALTMAVLHWTIADMGVPASHGRPVAELPSLMNGYREAVRFCWPLLALWLAGMCLMLLRLAWDARRIARLRRRPAPAVLVEAVRRLARERIGVTVPDVQMADVGAPQIVGWRRPVLLLPCDWASFLSSAESEAVLLHELAHVLRGDFGWNLLQRFVLAPLWFHPVAWHLYRCLSREREARCDALAVCHGASPTALARALVRLAENHDRPVFGMAISGQGEFTARIHRLLGVNHPPSLSPGLRTLAMATSMFCLVALGAGRLAVADPALADVYNASAFGPTISIDAHDAAGSFALQIRRGRVIGASIGKQQLSRDRILQEDDRVTLLGISQKPILALTVTPQDRFEWTARR